MSRLSVFQFRFLSSRFRFRLLCFPFGYGNRAIFFELGIWYPCIRFVAITFPMDQNVGDLASVLNLHHTINFPEWSIVSVCNRWWVIVALWAQVSRSVCMWFK